MVAVLGTTGMYTGPMAKSASSEELLVEKLMHLQGYAEYHAENG